MARKSKNRSDRPLARIGWPLALWSGLCAALLLAMLATRALRYGFLELPQQLDPALGIALVYQAMLFYLVWIFSSVFLKPLIAALVALLVLGHRFLACRYDQGWGLRKFVFALVSTGLVFGHAAFDLNPLLACFAWTSLIIFFLSASPLAGIDRWRESVLGRAVLFSTCSLACLYVWYAGDIVSAVCLGLMCLLLAEITGRFRDRVLFRDRFLLAVYATAATQGLAAIVPLALPSHLGRELIGDMAYSFCETAEGDRLYAALTRCQTLPDYFSQREDCLRGAVAEFEIPSFDLVAEHQHFDENWHGRYEQLVCLPDSVLVGLNGMVIDGREARDGIIEFQRRDPSVVRRNAAGPSMGHRLAYDPKYDNVYYVTEFGRGVIREHRPSGKLEQIKSWSSQTILSQVYSLDSYELGPDALHAGRDSLFVAEWLAGHNIIEINRSTSEVIATYPHNNGGSVGVTIDEENDRMFVVGMWGISAWDLSERRVVWRHRLGLLSRSPVIDKARGLIYVPSTVAGRIQVFDRETLALRGSIPIGFGTRLVYLSPDGERFYASSSRAAYWWPAEELARCRRRSCL